MITVDNGLSQQIGPNEGVLYHKRLLIRSQIQVVDKARYRQVSQVFWLNLITVEVNRDRLCVPHKGVWVAARVSLSELQGCNYYADLSGCRRLEIDLDLVGGCIEGGCMVLCRSTYT